MSRFSASPMPSIATRLASYRWPDERHLIPARCDHPGCGARLIRGDVPTAEHPIAEVVCYACSRTACELVYDGFRTTPRLPLTPAELHPRLGRPPKARPIDSDRLCPTCKERRTKPGRRRCEPCAEALRQPSEFYVRLLDVLATDTPLRSVEIAPLVGCALDTVRHLIQLARLRGVPVITEGRRYRIAGRGVA